MQAYQSVRLPANLIMDIKLDAEAEMRSVPKQMEFLIMLARAARDNPELPIDFIENCLLSKDETSVPFKFRD